MSIKFLSNILKAIRPKNILILKFKKTYINFFNILYSCKLKHRRAFFFNCKLNDEQYKFGIKQFSRKQ